MTDTQTAIKPDGIFVAKLTVHSRSDLELLALYLGDTIQLMRKEPYGIDSYVHVVKRGTRGLPITRNKTDKVRFLQTLQHLNDENVGHHWYQELAEEGLEDTFERASIWDVHVPLTEITAFCLHKNHFHLLLRETREGGISKFMQKMGTSMVMHHNKKYKEFGSLFQGSYRSRTIDTDTYLNYVHAYIQVKNVFEQHPNGYEWCEDNYDEAYAWAEDFEEGSLIEYSKSDLKGRKICNTEMFSKKFSKESYKKFARDVIEGRAHLLKIKRNSSRGITCE